MYTADLIGCVRFVYITPDEIAKHVENKPYLFQGNEGKELLLCIYRYAISRFKKKVQMITSLTMQPLGQHRRRTSVKLIKLLPLLVN